MVGLGPYSPALDSGASAACTQSGKADAAADAATTRAMAVMLREPARVFVAGMTGS
jgi:hypothetical protein